MHNLWVNECNGRQRASDVLAVLPLDRVWELHVAGGTELNGYALDAHSGPVPGGVWALANAWVPRMPNLGAIIFEVLDDHASRLGDGVLDGQWDRLQALWSRRVPADICVTMHAGHVGERATLHADEAWERTVAEAAIGRAVAESEGQTRWRDPGIALFRELIFDTRAGFVAQGLRYSMTLLLSALGPGQTRALLSEYAAATPPTLFASLESDGFARFLRGRLPRVVYLDEVLAYEHALVRASLYGETSTVTFTHDPAELLHCLDGGQVPQALASMTVNLVVDGAG